MFRFILILTLSTLLFSCIEDEEPGTRRSTGTVQGMAPIYAAPEAVYKVSVSGTKDIVNPGKIFTYKNFLIITIINEGFHVIDNTNPAGPRGLFFVNIPGNTDVAVKDDVFFANNFNDLVSFTFNTEGEIQLIERMSDAMQNGLAPIDTDVYFECVDPAKGVVVGWERKTLNNPKCFKP